MTMPNMRMFGMVSSAATYTITPAAASINEGSALTINVGGRNIPADTYYFTINHITSVSGDFSASSGSFSIASNAGSFTITPTADSSTEGAETFTVSIRSGSISGTILATSGTITVNDTSLNPTYTVTPVAFNINEGSALTINIGGTDIVNGTYYWTVTNSGDFTTSSGSFSISGNAGSFTVTPTADVTTEGAETFTVSIRSGSTSGTILATSASITINDTSLTPPSSVGTATFYTPLVNQLYGGASGTVGSAAFSVTSGWMKFSNPGGDWSAEITVGAGWGNASGHVGAVNQAFWNANPGYGQGTGDGAFWYLGYSFSYGDSSGTSASFNGSEYNTLPTSGQTVGLVYNSTNGKLRIYRNGTLVVTFTLSAGGTLYPAIGYWTGTIAGTWNSTTSAYFSSYVYPT